ncbi:hypothetical protein TDB9533_00775 [Thalassocella blandensis]|nr:hypothetical protein TDB9533_00775 [Thalassocella blandensis]
MISKKRDKETLFKFLERFIPIREESSDEYLIPQYSEHPKHVFTEADKVIDWCVANAHAEYCIYWRNASGGKPEHANVFYLKDGYVIYGLATDASYAEYGQELLQKVLEFLGA